MLGHGSSTPAGVGESALDRLIPELTHGANGVETHAGFFEDVGDGVHSYPKLCDLKGLGLLGLLCAKAIPIKKCVLVPVQDPEGVQQ